MRFEAWVVAFIISLIIGAISFFSKEYTVWFVFLIILIISIIGMISSKKKSKSNESLNQPLSDSKSTQKRIPEQNTENTTGMEVLLANYKTFTI